MPRKGRRKAESLEIVTRDCAGIDIGKDTHYVAVDPERCEEPVRSFDAFTPDLEEMAAWLSSCGVEKVAMESTSVYWMPVFEVLDRAGFEVMLVPPRMTKQISGRKSDVLDCQWIRQLLSYGLLRGAFRPGDAVCPLRSYVRQAKRLTDDRSRSVLHMQKALTEMNVRLDSVITDITGVTGQRILRAIIDGERDPRRLAALRDGRIKASHDRIAAALQGTWREEHVFALTQAMQRFDFLTEQIATCETQIAMQIDSLTPPHDGPDDDQLPGSPGPSRSGTGLPKAPRSNHAKRTAKERATAEALHRMMGVDLTVIPAIGVNTALTIAAEIGPDFSAFPSAQHFSSWLGLAPGTRISGGKSLPGRAPKAINKVAQSLRMAAMSARRSQAFIGARHRGRLARKDAPVAITATARELACLIYTLVTRAEEYVERGIETYERRRVDRSVSNLGRRAKQLGYQLVRMPEDTDGTIGAESIA
ncbi:MAG: IS110 family transposase [Boseongicola sp. SB0676_bin_33]|uniref:IS110 family transposase n=1 Tax=Boseongicola sp. SB0664_bin_43 TaxID=2604844 RepID=A0A6B0Y4C2_9RHOB|nr:IS110 family transposase [Boseongicola sp. SB0664_bin_43]MYF89507.1 IS110 family transposase [Boseongicola sp. SB0676_bin_33]MYK32875.1 IS110 family transposase [Boseongicola sp. SB0670_bin_30]